MMYIPLENEMNFQYFSHLIQSCAFDFQLYVLEVNKCENVQNSVKLLPQFRKRLSTCNATH